LFFQLQEASEEGKPHTSVGSIMLQSFLSPVAHMNILFMVSPSKMDDTFLPFFRKGKKYIM